MALRAGRATSLMSLGFAIMAPVWDTLADQYGRKLMVMRATFAGAILMVMMAWVTNVQQRTVLRFLRGVFTGAVSAATALVVGVVPQEHAGLAFGSFSPPI